MKKSITFLMLLSACCLMGGFAACDEDANHSPHKWVKTRTEVTCTQDGVETQYCEGDYCGTFSTSVFKKAEGHKLDDKQVCTECGQSLQSTAGLVYEIREPELLEKFDPYAVVVGYDGEETEVTVGYTPEGLPVKEIGEYAFKEKSITKITVCDVVEKVCRFAFENCASLTDVALSDSVKELEQGVFDKCTSLSEIELPKNLRTISLIFDDCVNLKNIAVAEGNLDLKSIDGNLYRYDSRVWIKDKVFTMDKYAPAKTETSFEIPDGVTSLTWNVFENCSQLTHIGMPDTLEWIGNGAFGGCTGLTEIQIPSSVKTIQSGAFRDCQGLTSVEIPANVTEIQWKIFPGCTNLKEIKVAEENPTYISINGNLYSKGDDGYYKANTLIEYAFGKKEETFAVPFGTSVIGNYAFDAVTSLKTLIIPEGVQEVDSFAFYDCDNLERIYFPNSLKTVGDQVFKSLHLEEVVYNGTKAEWEAIGGHLAWLWIETTVKVTCLDGIVVYTRNGFAIDKTEQPLP